MSPRTFGTVRAVHTYPDLGKALEHGARSVTCSARCAKVAMIT